MQIIVGIIFIALILAFIKIYWQFLLFTIIGSVIMYIIAHKKSEGMTEEQKKRNTENWMLGYFLCIIIFFIGACIADVNLKSIPNSDKDIKKIETVQTEKNDPVKKSFNVNEWCQRYFAIIDDIENKWKIFRENDSEFVVPMQNLARSMESAHNKIDNSPEYKVPEKVPENIKNKMQEVITNLYDGMEDLAYSLRVMAEYAEEVSGSNDLPNRMVIPYGASESEIYYYAEQAKERYNNAKIKFEIAKNLLNEINN